MEIRSCDSRWPALRAYRDGSSSGYVHRLFVDSEESSQIPLQKVKVEPYFDSIAIINICQDVYKYVEVKQILCLNKVYKHKKIL